MIKSMHNVVISGLIAMFALPTLAAPHADPHSGNKPQQHITTQSHSSQNSQKKAAQVTQKQTQKHQTQPHRDWKKGQVLDRAYRSNSYKVADYKKHSGLKKPTKNQRWIQVNGDYILINTLNNVIVNILAGR